LIEKISGFGSRRSCYDEAVLGLIALRFVVGKYMAPGLIVSPGRSRVGPEVAGRAPQTALDETKNRVPVFFLLGKEHFVGLCFV
jgi:hypothetical protein